MARSSSYDYSIAASEVIKAALEDIDVVKAGESVDADDSVMALRTLNLMVKQWMGKPDMQPGLKVWLRKTAYMFPKASTAAYSLGPSGDHATLSYGYTTLASALTSGNINPTLTAAKGVDADFIGIVQDDDTIHWTTIASGGGTTTPVLTAATTADAAAGNRVYTYTTKVMRPESVLSVSQRDNLDQDNPMSRMLGWEEYEAITNKYDTVLPTRWFYEAQLDNGVLYLDGYPDSNTMQNYVFRIVILIPTDDLDSTANDFSYPQQYLGALEWGLAKRLAPKFNKNWSQSHQDNYTEALMIAQLIDPESKIGYFQPNMDGCA